MSFVIATPELVTAAATDLANVGSSLGEASVAAAASTTGGWSPLVMRCRRPLRRCFPATPRRIRR